MVQQEVPSRERPSQNDVTSSAHDDSADENSSSRDGGEEHSSEGSWPKKDYDDYYLSLGVALQDYKMRNFHQCIPLFQELLENPVVKAGRAKAVNIHTHLAHSFYGTGEKEKAKEHFTNAIQLDPNNEMAHYGLYCLYEEQQDFEEALKHLMTVADDHPNENHINELVDLYMKLERGEEAARFLVQKEKELSAKNPEKHAALILKLKERRSAITGLPDEEEHGETVSSEDAEDEGTALALTLEEVTTVGVEGAEKEGSTAEVTTVDSEGDEEEEETSEEIEQEAEIPSEKEAPADASSPETTLPETDDEGPTFQEEEEEPEESKEETKEERAQLQMKKEWIAKAKLELVKKRAKEQKRLDAFFEDEAESKEEQETPESDEKTDIPERQDERVLEEKKERGPLQHISKLGLDLIKEKVEELEGDREQLKRREKQLEDQARRNALKEEELEALRKQLDQRKKDILKLEKKTMEKIKHAQEMIREERGRLKGKEETPLQEEGVEPAETVDEVAGKGTIPEEKEGDQKDVEESLESSSEEEKTPQPPTREFHSKGAEEFFLEGNRFLRERLYESAVSLYRKALQLEPDVAGVWNNMGVAFDEMGMTSKARLCYDEAIKLEESYGDAYLNKGYNLLKNNLYESALAAFEKVQEITPSIKEAREYSEFCKMKLGRV